MASAIRHCMRLVDLCLKPSHRLYLAKVIRGFVDHEPDKITIYVIDDFYKDFRWMARHHAPRMATHIVDHLKDIETS
jgi:hypothetical protein